MTCENCIHYDEVCFGINKDANKCNEFEDKSSIINNKETPMKLTHTISRKKCARCGHIITDKNCVKHKIKYCYNCGQKIDWEEEK